MDLQRQITDNVAITVLLGLLGLIIVGVYNTAFKKGFFTCRHYIFNTYLYILMALVIISLQVLSFDLYKLDIHSYIGGIMSFVIFLLLIFGILYLTMSINPRSVLLKHISWLIFLSIVSLIAYPSYLKSKEQNTLLPVLLSLVGILVFFSVIVYINPDLVSFSWGPILLFILVGFIISHLIFFLTLKKRNKTQNSNYIRFTSYGIILLFIFFIMYDTKKIVVGAKLCQEKTADYINQSLGIVIDALNIFSNLVNVTR